MAIFVAADSDFLFVLFRNGWNGLTRTKVQTGFFCPTNRLSINMDVRVS